MYSALYLIPTVYDVTMLSQKKQHLCSGYKFWEGEEYNFNIQFKKLFF